MADSYCRHKWVRDDATTKVCVYCKSYAPIRTEADTDD